jgi:hypothetical protein
LISLPLPAAAAAAAGAAAGALEAPLGNAVAGRTNSLGVHTAAAAGAAASSSPQLQLDASTAAGGSGLSPAASLSLDAANVVTDTVNDASSNNTAVAFSSLDSEQQHSGICTSPPAAAAAGAIVSSSGSYWPPQQQQLGRQLTPPMPAVTMVFLVVEGANVFGKGRRPLVKEIHAHLSQLLVEALKHVRGGYLCRMQVRPLLLLLL